MPNAFVFLPVAVPMGVRPAATVAVLLVLGSGLACRTMRSQP